MVALGINHVEFCRLTLDLSAQDITGFGIKTRVRSALLKFALLFDTEFTDDVTTAAIHLLAGFDEIDPLPVEQRELLYDSICARAILTVQLVAFYRDRLPQSDKYDSDDLASVMLCLERILATDREAFTRAIRHPDKP